VTCFQQKFNGLTDAALFLSLLILKNIFTGVLHKDLLRSGSARSLATVVFSKTLLGASEANQILDGVPHRLKNHGLG
jgi:hypothetical protein